VAPLVAAVNAVRDAIGLRINDLPLSPPRILAALDAAGS
jgi:CO/xanthine dehydrogenase Mo-binding subunit